MAEGINQIAEEVDQNSNFPEWALVMMNDIKSLCSIIKTVKTLQKKVAQLDSLYEVIKNTSDLLPVVNLKKKLKF